MVQLRQKMQWARQTSTMDFCKTLGNTESAGLGLWQQLGEQTMQPLRQGDVILLPMKQAMGTKLPHLTLAEGEVTGHRHLISKGEAELYKWGNDLCLKALSLTALLTHEQHQPIIVPQGAWRVKIQSEYEPEEWRGWRDVKD